MSDMHPIATFEELQRRLMYAAKELDAAIDIVRALGFDVEANVPKLAKAMLEVFMVEKEIFVVRPDLMPAQFSPPEDPE